jgi:ABC-type amino acid transport substrate-binding protein
MISPREARCGSPIAISSAGGPFWSAKDGANYSGVPADLGCEFAKQLGVPVQYVAYQNPGQITDAAAKGEWDVAFLPMDAERAKVLAFGSVYIVDDGTYLVRPGSTIATQDEVDRAGVRVAAVAVPIARAAVLPRVSKLMEDTKTNGTLRRALDDHGLKDTAIAP